MDNPSGRSAIFISHATPEDNAFVRWLGAKLAALGYEVWADVMRLRGGSDWSRELEEALRYRSAKVLVVCTPAGLEKQGVRNEIEIASNVATQIKDKHFIIPLRLENYQPHFRIAHLQHIDFKRSWSEGYLELAERLNDFPVLRKDQNRSTDIWLEAQRIGSAKLVGKDEWLVSNWLPVTGYPWKLYYCEPPVGFLLEKFTFRNVHDWPIVPYRSGVLTFATPDEDGFLAENIPAKIVKEIETKTFLDQGWDAMGIPRHEAWKKFADLGNQALEAFLNKKNLSFHDAGFGRRFWFGGIKAVPQGMVPYDLETPGGETFRGRRQIMGQSEKHGVFWHYAISGRVRTVPVYHVRISASLVFSSNGMDALTDTRKAHRLRRSFAKTWRNARWRDMMLTFLSWVAENKYEIHIPISDRKFLHLELPPIVFKSPVTVPHDGEAKDEDDSYIDESDFDEDQEAMEESSE